MLNAVRLSEPVAFLYDSYNTDSNSLSIFFSASFVANTQSTSRSCLMFILSSFISSEKLRVSFTLHTRN